MSSPHPDWPKWIVASINKYLIDSFASEDFIYHGDGQIISEEAKIKKGKWVELRLDGPRFRALNGRDTTTRFEVSVTIDIAVSVITELQGYLIHQISGKVASVLDHNIELFRYDGAEQHLECLRSDSLSRITNFGLVKSAALVKQSHIEKSYITFLEN